MNTNTLSTNDTLSRVDKHQRTATVRGRLLKEYGIDLSKIGKLTPEIVRASSLRLKGLGKQIKLAGKFAQNAEGIEAGLNQLEQVRVDMMSAGAGNLKQSDNLLSQAIMANAKLESGMKSQAAKLAGDLRVEELNSQQGLQQQQATLEGRLNTMAATHDAKMSLIGFKAKQALSNGVSAIQDGYRIAQDNARTDRELNSFISGESSSFRPRLPSFNAKGMFR